MNDAINLADPLLTVRQIMELLGISRKIAYDWVGDPTASSLARVSACKALIAHGGAPAAPEAADPLVQSALRLLNGGKR